LLLATITGAGLLAPVMLRNVRQGRASHDTRAKTAEANDGTLPAGPVALQYIAGTIKFRKVVLKPL
jgi:hypothetical protein